MASELNNDALAATDEKLKQLAAALRRTATELAERLRVVEQRSLLTNAALAEVEKEMRAGLIAAQEGLTAQYVQINKAESDAARALANSEAAGTRYDGLAAELRGLRESTDALFAATSADIEALGARVAALEPKPPPILVDEGPIVIDGQAVEYDGGKKSGESASED